MHMMYGIHAVVVVLIVVVKYLAAVKLSQVDLRRREMWHNV